MGCPAAVAKATANMNPAPTEFEGRIGSCVFMLNSKFIFPIVTLLLTVFDILTGASPGSTAITLGEQHDPAFVAFGLMDVEAAGFARSLPAWALRNAA